MSSYISTPSLYKREFISALQSITSGGLITVAHGLGAIPKNVELYVQNVTAEANWVPGDYFKIDSVQTQSAGTSYGGVVYADATNVYVRVGSGGFGTLNKNTGAWAIATNANWNFFVKAQI